MLYNDLPTFNEWLANFQLLFEHCWFGSPICYKCLCNVFVFFDSFQLLVTILFLNKHGYVRFEFLRILHVNYILMNVSVSLF